MQDVSKYIESAINLGADNAVQFEIDQIAFDSRTLIKCMFGCTDYGFGHTCPSRPGSLKPWEYKKIFSKYKGGIIIHSTSKKTSQDISFEVERQAFLDGNYFAFSLSDCTICPECTGFKGKPCAHPLKARPAFHSVGIDVFATVKHFDLPLDVLNVRSETTNWYSAVFIY